MSDFIPTTAPFSEDQRAWLNGFFAGLTGIQTEGNPAAVVQALGIGGATAVAEPEPEEEEFAWRDSSLPIVERVGLADGHPTERKLMAAMAQLDCGSCGYVCQTYGEAIAKGEETNLTLCSPGGKETKQMIKKILAESKGSGSSGNVDSGASSGDLRNGTESRNGAAASRNGAAAQWSRNNPFSAKLIESRPLNLEGSAKDTRHVVIDLTGSGLKYNVGDALGVLPSNCPDLATKLIDSIAADSQISVATPSGNTKTLLQALCEDYCLKDPSDELIELLAGRIQDASAKATLTLMLEEGVPDGFDVLDVLEVAQGVTVTATEVIETLDPLNPRLYSIASSMKRVGDQVHLTVGKVVYEREGRVRKGVASTMLADRVSTGETVRVFVQPNHAGFTVPSAADTPMIMVGPGTGIAPFLSFLQERAESNAPGSNWLFFGDQHEAFDFLYREELEEYVGNGLLTRLDTAFSRDDERKVYVQDRMREQAAEIWQWLESGAAFYVCGDASRMARDVDKALHDIAVSAGGLSAADAAAYVKQLSTSGRYHRDVY
ncbi:sulfite reductase subunit alpha [Allorhodopirellula heiligendammensis]|uniref:assimilatory sulfite reductase (NADPH) n=1 Tax=Allorhodopirellula heiligendammensis TaxID=2714739 RepID=A0A5C6C1C1_9BACT|nr:sulfite reductase subunit alpha [Allorhodopirellula heiligendammensis]TWU17915.1 Sulfite reductase [NADPH] flavoprotein alpha-component [Allorhodopirellula heiligendammensis]